MQLIQTRQKTYHSELKRWLQCHGLEGGGGPYIRETRKYTPMPEPKAPAEDEFEERVFAAIRAQLVKDYAPSLPKAPAP